MSTSPTPNNHPDHHPVVVIGGGQAGLSVSYHLQQRDVPHVVLDASEHAGDTWRHRWDSLRLFTPARLDHLDGMAFPRKGVPPSKDEFADYLDAYESQLVTPVRHGTRVRRLSSAGDGYRLETTGGLVTADAVVVAMSSLQVPKVPALAGDLAPGIRSLHSVDYRNPEQLDDGGVLVVGVGNTGAEISHEVAASHPTWLAGEESGELPFRIDGAFGQHVATRFVAFAFLHVLTTGTPIGRRARPTLLDQADPLMRERSGDLRRAGVQRVARITEVRDGLPVTADGEVLEVANVIWCTGFRSGLRDWLDVDVLDERELPVQDRGVVDGHPGLYFVGQNFLYAKASETVPGVGRDAAYVADRVWAAWYASQTSGRNRPRSATAIPAS